MWIILSKLKWREKHYSFKDSGKIIAYEENDEENDDKVENENDEDRDDTSSLPDEMSQGLRFRVTIIEQDDEFVNALHAQQAPTSSPLI